MHSTLCAPCLVWLLSRAEYGAQQVTASFRHNSSSFCPSSTTNMPFTTFQRMLSLSFVCFSLFPLGGQADTAAFKLSSFLSAFTVNSPRPRMSQWTPSTILSPLSPSFAILFLLPGEPSPPLARLLNSFTLALRATAGADR